jgi:putative phage-type endonuclease
MSALTPEQLELRRTGIGSSEIGVLAGVSLYETPMGVWLKKRGILENGQMTPEQEWGHELEDVVARRYARERAGSVVEVTTLVHATRPWMLATPDRWFSGPDGRWLLECKTANIRQLRYWGPPGTDEVPPQYLVQGAWQMAVTVTERCDVAALIAGNDYRTYELHRDEELEAGLVDIGERFWFDHVQADIPPPLDASEATRKWLASRFPRDWKPLIAATPSVAFLVRTLRRIEEDVDRQESRAETLRAQLMEHIGDAAGITGDFGTITWKVNKKGVRSFRPTWAKETDNGSTTDAAGATGQEEPRDAPGAAGGIPEIDGGRASVTPNS